MHGSLTNNLANTDGQELSKLAASLTTMNRGFSAEVDLVVSDMQKIFWVQNTSWYTSDGVYTTGGGGFARLWLNEDAVMNLTLQATADTEMGPEKKLCTSMVIIDTVQYEGKAAEFDASFLSWNANTATIFKNEQKLDISAGTPR